MSHKKIWLSTPHMGGSEMQFINEAFESNWVAPLGENVDGLEKDLCSYSKVSNAAVLSSGTAAIHLALIILGVKAGDEVICQSMTFSATANPILYQNATPVFIDSEEDSWNMCPKLLRTALADRLAKGKKVKAIIPVHLYGMPANMHAIMEIAKEFGIPVIEDAAEALGSKYYDRAVGSYGQFGILSFNGNKIITTSGGGALLSNDLENIKWAKFYATQAKDDAPHYEHSKIGYNYRMSNISAGIGRGQMQVLDERVKQRRNNFEYYQKKLSHIPPIRFNNEPQGCYSNRWLTTILIDPNSGVTREDLRLAMEMVNIESRPLWKPMHLQPVFEGAPYYENGFSARLFEMGLCLPSSSNLTKEELDRVIETIELCYAKVSINN